MPLTGHKESFDKFPVENVTRIENVPQKALLSLLETLLASAPVGFALFDSKLCFICINPSFAGFTGFAPE